MDAHDGCPRWMPMMETQTPAETPPERIALPVEGMECAACAVRIEKRLGKQPGVRAAAVNYATHEALVEYDAEATGLARLAEAVEGAGYGVRTEVLTVPLAAATGAEALEAALARHNGWLAVEAVGGDTAALRYVPGVAAPDALVRTLEAAGLAAPGTEVGRGDEAAAEREAEARYRAMRRRLVVAAVLSLPVVVIAMAHGALDFAGSRLVQFGLTTPVVVWAGRGFFTGAWKAAWHRAADMSTLVALGVGAAYGYSTVATFAPGVFMAATGRHPDVYFEAAAVIVTLILVGRVLEERARGKTGAAIRRLMTLQPDTARVVRDGREAEVPVADVVVG